MIRRLALLTAVAATPAAAQDHSMHDMPGMTMPAPPVAKPRPKPRPKPAARPTASAPVEPSTMDHSTMQGMDHTAPTADPHAGHVMPAQPPATAEPIGTDLPPGNAPAPPVPTPHYADRIWDPARMARARDVMMREDGGGQRFAQIMLDLAEVRSGKVGASWRWEGSGWFGGDIDRFVVKTEGEGANRVESAEIQALYSRAIGPYFNLQAGVRHDIRPMPDRTYATIGVEGLAPYWFDVAAAAFVSTRGDVLGRVEGYYDQRITQRLIAQPRVELNLSAQDVPVIGLGSGLTSAELGLRLRYEIRREFAPYIGLSWDRRVGDTARLARDRGEDVGGIGAVAGLRLWF